MYFTEKMVTYRSMAEGSWSEALLKKPLESRFPIWDSLVDMLKGLDVVSEGKYHKTFKRTYVYDIHNQIFRYINERKKIEKHYPDIIAEFKTTYAVENFFLRHGMYNMALGCFLLWSRQYKCAFATLPLTSSVYDIYVKLRRLLT